MGFYRGPNLVTNGLVLSLDAGNTKSYPGSGTTWLDKSGYGNNGTLTNGPTFDSGSIVFDEIDDYVIIPNNSSLNLTESGGAVTAWFKTNVNSTGSLNGNIIAKTNTYTNGYWLAKYNDKLRISLYGTSNLEMIGTRTIVDNNWHYAVATWTSAQLSLYVDGTLDRTQSYSFTITTATNPLYIGRQNNTGEKYFKGNIAQVQIYNRALSAQEILQNYNATKSRFNL